MLAAELGVGRWIAALRRAPPAVWIVPIALAVGLAMFVRVFGFGILSPQAPVWRNPDGDMLTMLAGAEAVFDSAWRFPPTISTALVAPLPVSIVFTDSLPWLTLILKALSLGHAVNLLGLALLVSYLLQGLAMVAVVRSMGAKRLETMVAAALIALLAPPWIARQMGHIALTWHWLLLLSLALSIGVARYGLSAKRVAAMVCLTLLAVGIHAYHLPPMAVLFGAALASELLQRRVGALGRVALASVGMIAVIAAGAWILAYGSGRGVSDGGTILGFYSMNVLGPVMPQASALAGQHWRNGWFTGTVDPTGGGQAFEGYNYMGGGALFLLVAALCFGVYSHFARENSGAARGAPVATTLRADRDGPEWRRFGPLALGLLVLSLAAIGPKPYAGMHLLFELPRPQGKLGEALGLFRSHGRMFWTVGYAATGLALVTIERLSRHRLLQCVFILAVILQAFDVSRLQAALHRRFSAPAELLYPTALLSAPALHGRPMRFFPPQSCMTNGPDELAASQLSYLALMSGGSSNATNTARPIAIDCSTPPWARMTAPLGDSRIVISMAAGRRFGGALADLAERKDCGRFPRGVICGQGLKNVADLSAVSGVDLVEPLYFGTSRFGGAGLRSGLGLGWSESEPFGIWSDGPTAQLLFSLPQRTIRPTDLRLELMAYRSAQDELPQPVTVLLNGKVVGKWKVIPREWREYKLQIPAGTEFVDARLLIPEASKPPKDRRLLGVAIRSLNLGAAAG